MTRLTAAIKIWQATHQLSAAQAARRVRIPVETWRGWIYAKSRCAHEEHHLLHLAYHDALTALVSALRTDGVVQPPEVRRALEAAESAMGDQTLVRHSNLGDDTGVVLSGLLETPCVED